MTAPTVQHCAIYRGQIRHRRFAVAQHAFSYPIALLYIDLAELPHVFRNVPFWSAQRPALGWFREQDYLARFNTPQHKLYLHLKNHQHGERITDATLTLQRQACTRSNLLNLLWQFPLQTVQVGIGIYWQAWRLWLRGARFHPHRTRNRSVARFSISTPEEIHP